ncbi:MAG: hypothetical protein ACPGTU_14880, partial [Myxococcota bacterium]
MLSLLSGCAARSSLPGDLSPTIEAPSMILAGPSGLIHDGKYRDNTHGFSVDLLEGWVAEPGAETSLMRVGFEHVATTTRIEFWVFAGENIEPRVRGGCVWSFVEQGRLVQDVDEVVVATCVPEDPQKHRIFGTIFRYRDAVMQVEMHVPTVGLLEGKETAEAVLRTLAW